MHLLSLRSREFRVVVLLLFTQPVSTNTKRPASCLPSRPMRVDKCNFKLQCSLRCCCMSFHFSSLCCSSYFPPPTDLERNKSASMKAGRTSSPISAENQPTQMSSLPQESGVALHHRSLPALRMTSAARRKAMGIGGGAVLFFADDGDGLAGASLMMTVAAALLRRVCARRWCFRLSCRLCRLPGCLGVASLAP